MNTVRETYTRHGIHMNQKGKEQIVVKITNEVKNVPCGKNLNPINLNCQNIVIDAADVRDEDGESKGRLPMDSQRNSELHEQEHGILRRMNKMNYPQKEYAKYVLIEMIFMTRPPQVRNIIGVRGTKIYNKIDAT